MYSKLSEFGTYSLYAVPYCPASDIRNVAIITCTKIQPIFMRHIVPINCYWSISSKHQQFNNNKNNWNGKKTKSWPHWTPLRIKLLLNKDVCCVLLLNHLKRKQEFIIKKWKVLFFSLLRYFYKRRYRVSVDFQFIFPLFHFSECPKSVKCWIKSSLIQM